jgi:hypothetical protein
LDTDLAALESLRDWYKKVRQQYGVGFGQKVILGMAMLDLPVALARGLRSLSERGLHEQLDDLLAKIASLKDIFAPVYELQSDTTLLAGKNGTISRLLASLDKAILACKPLITDDSISIADLTKRIKLIDSLRKGINKWRRADIDKKVFRGRLGLKPGVNVDNSSSLSMLRNTLFIASCVDKHLENKYIQCYIYNQPSVSTFSELSEIKVQLKTAVIPQTARYEAFEQLVGLDTGDWMNRSGDIIESLII